MRLLPKHKIFVGPKVIRFGLNLWPPYLFAGIHVQSISRDFRCVEVELRSRFLNSNYVGTHFGGSLYAMIDPFFMLMVMKNLDHRYYVWDQEARIRFVKPGRQTVFAKLEIHQDEIDDIITQCASGEKYIKSFFCHSYSKNGEIVCDIEKKVYIRLKEKYR